MSEIRIAGRYAKSLLELGEETGKINDVAADIQLLKSAFQSRDLVNLIKSPIINQGKKLDIFSKLFTGKLSELTMLFLKRVIKKGRESMMPEMVGSFIDQLKDKRGIVDVSLTTIPGVNDGSLGQISAKINELVGAGKQIELSKKTDDDLIGGFVLEFEGKRYDASVRHQLENIRKSFSS